jgi:hypothetical protein
VVVGDAEEVLFPLGGVLLALVASVFTMGACQSRDEQVSGMGILRRRIDGVVSRWTLVVLPACDVTRL